MKNNNGFAEAKSDLGGVRFDLLEVLGRVGLRSLREKIFGASLFSILISIVVSCLAAFWSLSGSTGQPVSDVLGRMVLAGALALLFLGWLAFLFSSSVSGAVNRLRNAAESLGAGDLSSTADVR